MVAGIELVVQTQTDRKTGTDRHKQMDRSSCQGSVGDEWTQAGSDFTNTVIKEMCRACLIVYIDEFLIILAGVEGLTKGGGGGM